MKRTPPRRTGFKSKARPGKKTVALTDPVVAASKGAWGPAARQRPCAVCGTRFHVQGHHVLPLEDLIREGVDRRYWFDLRNQLSLCGFPSVGRCHIRHEQWVRRVPRSVVIASAPAAPEFADEVGLSWLFDREYPDLALWPSP